MKKTKIKQIMRTMLLLVFFTAIGIFMCRETVFAISDVVGKINFGEHKLYVNCYGKGNPTVVFESGYGRTSKDWRIVQKAISKTTRTFSYDRFARHANDPGNLPRTCMDQVKELHSLLKKAKVKAPYVLVAHSLGGYNARLFATAYPKEVAGIVFVDGSHEDEFNEMIADPVEKKAAAKRFARKELSLEEMLRSADLVRESREKDALRNIPIMVLTADYKGKEDKPGENAAWYKLQTDIASLSNFSTQLLVKNTGHFIQKDQPQVVIASIKKLLKSIKQ